MHRMNKNQFSKVEDEKDQSQEQYGTIQVDGIEMDTDDISPENDRFPYCIVWTALPLITWIIPFIGHTGIALANGVIHDFAGPYTIAVDNFTFGKPLKYVKISQENITKDKYDAAIIKADNKYCQMMHNIFWYRFKFHKAFKIIKYFENIINNCHNHVADALNYMGYMGKSNWNMVSVWFICLWSSKYVSWGALACTYLPLTIIVGITLMIQYFT